MELPAQMRILLRILVYSSISLVEVLVRSRKVEQIKYAYINMYVTKLRIFFQFPVMSGKLFLRNHISISPQLITNVIRQGDLLTVEGNNIRDVSAYDTTGRQLKAQSKRSFRAPRGVVLVQATGTDGSKEVRKVK